MLRWFPNRRAFLRSFKRVRRIEPRVNMSAVRLAPPAVIPVLEQMSSKKNGAGPADRAAAVPGGHIGSRSVAGRAVPPETSVADEVTAALIRTLADAARSAGVAAKPVAHAPALVNAEDLPAGTLHAAAGARGGGVLLSSALARPALAKSYRKPRVVSAEELAMDAAASNGLSPYAMRAVVIEGSTMWNRSLGRWSATA